MISKAVFAPRLLMFAAALVLIASDNRRSCGAEITLDADQMRVQIVSINRGDAVNWTSKGSLAWALQSYAGEYKLLLSSNNLEVSRQFNSSGTNYYRRFLAESDIDTIGFLGIGGIVIVRDWTNEPPTVTVNSPVEGMIFNYSEAGQEAIPLMASSSIPSNLVTRVEFFSNGTPINTLTNVNYSVPRAQLTPGSHSIVARVTETNGQVHESAPVIISVQEITAPVLEIRYVRELNLMVVSWREPSLPNRTLRMGRDEIVANLPAAETSSTSKNGVRFWLERVQPVQSVFFQIRERF